MTKEGFQGCGGSGTELFYRRRHQGAQEKRREGHPRRFWHVFKSSTQGSQGSQSADRRTHQNQSPQRRQISSRQKTQSCRLSI